MREQVDDRHMKKAARVKEVEALLREIQRYLACVDAFRATGPGRESKPKGSGGEKS